MTASGASRLMRKAWYFREQRGVCCLQILDACKQRDGAMQCEIPHRGDFATWEHLLPRSKIARCDTHTLGKVQLLACRACNRKKADHVGDDRMIEVAEVFFRAWEKFVLDLETARRAAGLPAPHRLSMAERFARAGLTMPGEKGRAA